MHHSTSTFGTLCTNSTITNTHNSPTFFLSPPPPPSHKPPPGGVSPLSPSNPFSSGGQQEPTGTQQSQGSTTCLISPPPGGPQKAKKVPNTQHSIESKGPNLKQLSYPDCSTASVAKPKGLNILTGSTAFNRASAPHTEVGGSKGGSSPGSPPPPNRTQIRSDPRPSSPHQGDRGGDNEGRGTTDTTVAPHSTSNTQQGRAHAPHIEVVGTRGDPSPGSPPPQCRTESHSVPHTPPSPHQGDRDGDREGTGTTDPKVTLHPTSNTQENRDPHGNHPTHNTGIHMDPRTDPPKTGTPQGGPTHNNTRSTYSNPQPGPSTGSEPPSLPHHNPNMPAPHRGHHGPIPDLTRSGLTPTRPPCTQRGLQPHPHKTYTPSLGKKTLDPNKVKNLRHMSRQSRPKIPGPNPKTTTNPTNTGRTRPDPPTIPGSQQPQSSHIVNLSSYTLNQGEIDILNKGLTFIPTPMKMDKKEMEVHRDKTLRRIKLADFFTPSDEEDDPPTPNPPQLLPIRSKFNPTKCVSPILETFCLHTQELYQQLISSWSKPTKHNNTTKKQTKAIWSLDRNKNITIKPADKGASIVIMDTKDYAEAIEQQLSNTKYYKTIPQPLRFRNAERTTTQLQSMERRKVITKKELDWLTPEEDPKARHFYGLPKIHKEKAKWSNNLPPLRPITSDVGSESHKTALYIDKHIKPLSTTHKSYLKDTWHFLDVISNTPIPDNALLITCDVESLYTNIPIQEGIDIIKQALDSRPRPHTTPTMDVIRLLEIQARNNDFAFNHQYYHQIHGTAMGKRWAPSLADLYMANWEKKLELECNSRGILFPDLWKRFLDDIFTIWVQDLESWNTFLQVANNLDPNIKIVATVSETSLDFLDTTIFKGPRFQQCNILDHKIYYKPTDTHQYLEASSHHPEACHKGLIKGQFIRLARLHNNFQHFRAAAKQMSKFFRQRGYKRRLINTTLKRVTKQFAAKFHPQQNNNPSTSTAATNASTDTNTTSHNNQNTSNNQGSRNNKQRIPAVITYHRAFARTPKLQKELYQQFTNPNNRGRERIQQVLSGPLLSAFKRTNNLKDLLVCSKTTWPPPPPKPRTNQNNNDNNDNNNNNNDGENGTNAPAAPTNNAATTTRNTTNTLTHNNPNQSGQSHNPTPSPRDKRNRPFRKCGTFHPRNCIYCTKITNNTKQHITVSNTGTKIPIQPGLHCLSQNLIYCITCKVCSSQYIGQTGRHLSKRLQEHFYKVTSNQLTSPVAKHFNSPQHNGVQDMQITIIKTLPDLGSKTNNTKARLREEQYFITKFASTHPLGIN